MTRARTLSFVVVTALAAVFLRGAVPRANATSPITVTVTATTDNGSGGELRAALATVLANPGGGTIHFNLGSGAQTITLTQGDNNSVSATLPAAPFGPTGLVVLGNSVTIDGSAVTGGLTITTSGTQRLFSVTGGRTTNSGNTVSSPTGSLTLVNLTLSGGTAGGFDAGFSGASAGVGGAVFVDAGSTLVLEGCLVTGCQALGGNANGPVTDGAGLGGSSLSGTGGPPNGVTGAPGGFGGGGASGEFNGGFTFGGGFGGGGGFGADDQNGGKGGFGGGGGGGGEDLGTGAGAGGTGGFGGGNASNGAGGSTGGGGGGAGLGGGIFVNGGTLQVANSTFTGCTAQGGVGGANPGQGFGGAIFQRNGTVSIVFSTLAFNTAGTDGGALYSLGDTSASADGSDPSTTGTATLNVDSSILSNSVTAFDDFVSNTWDGTTLGAGGTVSTGGGNSNIVVNQAVVSSGLPGSAADPLLVALASNGGPTKTLALGKGSPALGAGDTSVETAPLPTGAGSVDQRGFPRGGGVADVGAFEHSLVVTSTADDGSAGTLRSVLGDALTNQTVTFNLPTGQNVITLTQSDPNSTGATLPQAPFGPTGLVVLAKTVTIDGSAVGGGLTITTSFTQRLFAVTGGRNDGVSGNTQPGAASLTLVNLTLSGGNATGGSAGGEGGGAAGLGGAIFVDAGSTTTLEGCLVTACEAQGGNGDTSGATGSSGAGLGGSAGQPNAGFPGSGNPPTNSGGSGGFGGGGGGSPGDGAGSGGFGGGGGTSPGGTGGFGGGGGGGAANAASVFGGGAGSSAGGGGGAGLGGGIFVNGGTLNVVNSTLTGCSALGGTGGNAGSGNGGAIFQRNGTVSIAFSTLAFNTAPDGGGALYTLGDGSSSGDGSGASTASLAYDSSIFSNSTSGVDDVVTAFIGGALSIPTQSDSIIVQQGGAQTLTASSADPQLSALGFNGGLTQTLALAATSPAIGAGNPSVASTAEPAGPGGVNQRGFPRNLAIPCVGAYERQVGPFMVTNFGETHFAGFTTLREAFSYATGLGSTTITFSSGLLADRISLTRTDGRSQGQSPVAPFGNTALVVNGDQITIDGTNAPGVSIDAGGAQRLFAVTGGGTLAFKNITLSGGFAKGGDGGTAAGSSGNGNASGGGAAGLGGALYVDSGATATLVGCTVMTSTAQGGNGGAADGGSEQASGGGGLGGNGGVGTTSAPGAGGPPNGGANNDSGAGGLGGPGGGGGAGSTDGGLGGFGGGGGGAQNDVGGAGGFGGGGGGAYNGAGGAAFLGGTGGAGTVATSGGGGGGAGLGGGVFVNGGTLQVTNCTFTQCSAVGGSGATTGFGSAGANGQGLGGAIFQRNGTVSVVFATVAFNTASSNGGAIYLVGDGSAVANLTVDSTILSNSTLPSSSTAIDDLVSSTNAGGGINAAGGSNVIVLQTVGIAASNGDPKLAGLAGNGGPTETLALQAGSSAIGAGDTGTVASAPPNGAGSVDQRGLPRGATACDVGAFELQTSQLNTFSGDNQSAAVGQAFGSPVVFQVLDESGTPVVGATVTVTPPSSGASASFTGSLTTDSSGKVTLTFTANGTTGAYSVGVSTPGLASGVIGTITDSISLTNTAGSSGGGGGGGGGGGSTPTPSPSPSPSPSPTTPVLVFSGGGGTVTAGVDSPVFTGSVTATLAGGASGTTLTISFTGAGTGDLLGIDTTQSALGGNLVVGGVAIGTVTGGGSAPIVVTFNSQATAGTVESILARIVFRGETQGSVTISAVLRSSSGVSSTPIEATVTVTGSSAGGGSSGHHGGGGCVVALGGQGDPRSLLSLGAVLSLLVVSRRRAKVKNRRG